MEGLPDEHDTDLDTDARITDCARCARQLIRDPCIRVQIRVVLMGPVLLVCFHLLPLTAPVSPLLRFFPLSEPRAYPPVQTCTLPAKLAPCPYVLRRCFASLYVLRHAHHPPNM